MPSVSCPKYLKHKINLSKTKFYKKELYKMKSVTKRGSIKYNCVTKPMITKGITAQHLHNPRNEKLSKHTYTRKSAKP